MEKGREGEYINDQEDKWKKSCIRSGICNLIIFHFHSCFLFSDFNRIWIHRCVSSDDSDVLFLWC